MKRTFLYLVFSLVLVTLSLSSAGQYSDHRGYNLDSLERAVARWTPEEIDSAPDSVFAGIVKDWNGLMSGYLQMNGVKSEFYARKILSAARMKGWYSSVKDASKTIGQTFWAKEQYDSAAFYYGIALDALKHMAEGATSPSNPEGYSQVEIDDGYSSLYGTLGNLYNMKGELDSAFAYYSKAGEIFTRYGWNESNAVLYYNMGETWLEEKNYDMAQSCYEESLRFGRQAGDSLWIATPLKGLGALYLETGRTGKALRCLEEADKYFSIHEDQEFQARLETLGFMGQVLREQRRQLKTVLFSILAVILLLVLSIVMMRILRRTRKEKDETGNVLEETISEIRPSSGTPTLSEREKEILELSSKGLTAPQIADRICLSPETVKWYRKKLLVKFDCSNIAELISKAKDSGIL